MTSEVRQKYFFYKAADMYRKYVLKNAPLCEKCGTLMSKTRIETNGYDDSVSYTQYWICLCGEEKEGATYVPSSQNSSLKTNEGKTSFLNKEEEDFVRSVDPWPERTIFKHVIHGSNQTVRNQK